MAVIPKRTGTVRSAIDALPAGTWVRCPRCRVGLHGERLRRAHGVCPSCSHHLPLGAEQRLVSLLDPGTLVPFGTDIRGGDPLEFTDRLPYTERLRAASARSGRPDSALAAEGHIHGSPVVVFVLDFTHLAGSMGTAVGDVFSLAARRAGELGVPLISVASSGGARMQEGIFALMQMARTAAAVNALHDRGQPFVSVLADPCFGGVSASFASLADVIIAEPAARAGFAGRTVVEQTLRQQLPVDFQTAETLLEFGHLDAVVPRAQLRAHLSRVVRAHRRVDVPVPTTPAPPATPTSPGRSWPGHDTDPVDGRAEAWDSVVLARRTDRPQTRDLFGLLLTDFVELRGDRTTSDDPAVVCGIGVLEGRPVVAVGHHRGHDTQDRLDHRFGMAEPAGYRKVQRSLKHAQRFGLSVVTVIDTPGAYPGVTAERDNQSGAIARCIADMCALTVPTIALVLGEGGSGGALAIGVADRLLMMENSTLSVISPEGCATILYGHATHARTAATSLKVGAHSLFELGMVDEVLPEPVGGAHVDWALTARVIGGTLRRHLTDLESQGPEVRTARRAAVLLEHGRRRAPASDRPPGDPSMATTAQEETDAA